MTMVTAARKYRRTVLREHPACLAICRIAIPSQANSRISTACSWVNIVGGQKAAILAQLCHLYSVAMGQYYPGANIWRY
jgi:hypothetical protein